MNRQTPRLSFRPLTVPALAGALALALLVGAGPARAGAEPTTPSPQLAPAVAPAEPGPAPKTASTARAATAGSNLSVGPMISRAGVMRDALGWLALDPRYSQTAYYHGIADPATAYRTDCSGFVSMAWDVYVNQPNSISVGGYVTWTLPTIAVRLPSDLDLEPGDILDYPSTHVVLFTGWVDKATGVFSYIAQTEPGLNMQMSDTESVLTGDIASYPFNDFIPYRYENIVTGGASGVWGDWDSDRTPDLLATTLGGNTIYFYEGNGVGGFTFGHAAPILTGVSQYTDMVRSPRLSNGSLDPDVVAIDKSGGLWILPGTGVGSFGPPVQVGQGFTGSRVLAPGDVTGDGNNDLLVITPTGALDLLHGNGEDHFAAPVQIGQGFANLQVVSAGYLTGNGRPDLLAITPTGALELFAGNGKGKFAAPVPVGHGWYGTWRLDGVGDFNGDGHADLLAIDPEGNLWLYPGTGTGGFGTRVLLAPHWSAMNPF
jgi:hypothetical protein